MLQERNEEVVSRREALRLAMGGLALTLLVACAPAAPQGAAPASTPLPTGTRAASTATVIAVAPAPTTTTTEEPRSGGSLHVAQNVEIASGGQAGVSPLDANNITPATLSAIWLGFDTLIAYDANYKPQPMLAESWEVAPDFKQVTFTLRKGVEFHNGREFTSDDVKYNLLRVRDPKVGAQFTNMSNWWSDIQTPDPYTITLTSDQSRPALFDLFELLNMSNKDITESPDFMAKSGGTGPFMFAEWVQGDHIRWVKNPNYWQSGRPYLEEVVIPFVPDAQTMVVQLEAGAIQGVDTPPTTAIPRLQQNPQQQVLTNDPSGQYWIVVANTTAGPTADKRVRQAINYAIDRQRFVDTVLNHSGPAESLPWPTFSPAYDQARGQHYMLDLERAKSLLDEAGATNTSLDFLYNSVVPEIGTFGQMLQANLAEVGLTINLKGVERAAFNAMIAQFQYGLLMSNSGFAALDPTTLPLVSRYWDVNNNLAGFNGDSRYKQLVTTAAIEPDAGKRRQELLDLDDEILDQSFSMAVAPSKHVVSLASNVHGFRFRLTEANVYTDTWLS
ncbi:MAG: ABC transporter substrate-binding protein [Chloroflexi bacterium]|nr:ABC transporter substrate-binding protein [Chloroflexota bacterium]